MKKLRYIAGSGALMLLTAFAASCTDGNEWGTDASYDRLFGTQESSFSITAADNIAEAEATWAATQNTSSYIIEVSTSALTDDVEMGTTEGSIVYGNGDEQITGTTYTLKGLAVNATYYARIKSVGVGKESNWVALDGTFTTCEEEQILNAPSTDAGDITENSIKISWVPCEVDKIRIFTADGSYDETFELSEADVAFASYTFEGLSSATEYIIEIYSGETLRGTLTQNTSEGEMEEVNVSNITFNSATFSWAADISADGYTLVEGISYSKVDPIPLSGSSITVSSIAKDYTTYTFSLLRGTSIIGYKTFTTKRNPSIPGYTTVSVSSADDLLNAEVSENTIFLIPATSNLTLNKGGDIKITSKTDGVNVIVWGEQTDNATKATLQLDNPLGIKGKFTTVEFFNLKVSATDANKDGRVFNLQDDSNSFTEFKLEACDITDGKNMLRVKHSAEGGALGALTINNCFVSDFTGDGSLVILSEEKSHTLTTVNITNSTIVNMVGSVIRSKECARTFNISQCTFYNAPNKNGGAVTNDDKKGSTFNISNTLFGGAIETDSGYRDGNAVNEDNVYTASDFTYGKNPFGKALDKTSAELFPNAASNDFTVGFGDYKAYGDPRWKK